MLMAAKIGWFCLKIASEERKITVEKLILNENSFKSIIIGKDRVLTYILGKKGEKEEELIIKMFIASSNIQLVNLISSIISKIVSEILKI